MRLFLKTKDFSVSGEEFELVYDEYKDMLLTQPQPDNLTSYYESESYISHTDANKSLFDKLYQTVKHYNLRKKVTLINSYKTSSKKILDVGAGTGDFLKVAQSNGWQTAGVEPNVKARTKAQQKGVPLVDSLEKIKDDKFACITLWHVLEHLPDLESQIMKIVNLIDDEGTLFIAVPNFKSFDAAFYGTYWAGYDVPRHLWHFSQTSIGKLFKNHDLHIVKTIPMLFDAFYVSFLSEKYKAASQKVLRAFCIGLWSNIKGWFTKEYSSHIYILKKAK